MNAFENMVYETALESVGSYENAISDNGLEGTDAVNKSRDWIMNYARRDVMDECPREVRFLGAGTITKLCYKAADTFKYRSW